MEIFLKLIARKDFFYYVYDDVIETYSHEITPRSLRIPHSAFRIPHSAFLAILCSFLTPLFSFGQTPRTVTPPAAFVHPHCGCLPEDEVPEIDLRIYRGLKDPYGGQIVPDDDEYTLGSITVANLNDTDGDGVTDNEDPQVLASDYGRDEVDLMKLTITKSGTFAPSCTHLDLEVSAHAELWTSATKGTIAKRRYALSELPVTLWLEAKTHSEALRDIRVFAKVNGEVFDRVAATAIWLEAEAGFTERKPTPKPEDLNINESDLINIIDVRYISMTDGTRYGYGPYRFDPGSPVDIYFGGRILVGFKVFPEEVIPELSQYDIIFDGGRRVENEYEVLKYSPLSENIPIYQINKISSSALQQVEYINDDGETPKKDEDNVPEDTTTLVYAFDAPGEPFIISDSDENNAYKSRLSEFEEFVRISFGSDPSGDGIKGSRCSQIREWKSKYNFVSRENSRSNPYDYGYQVFRDMTWHEVEAPSPRLLKGKGNGTVNYDFDEAPSGVFLVTYDEIAKSWNISYTSYESDFFKRDIGNCFLSSENTWAYSGTVTLDGVNLGSISIEIVDSGSKKFANGSILSIPNLKSKDADGFILVTK